MKNNKKKIVFTSIILIVLIFIVSYTTLVFFGDEEIQHLDQPLVPELKEDVPGYTSKLKALDALKEEREKQIPSIYSETLLDSAGVYDSALEEKELAWMEDSIYPYELLENIVMDPLNDEISPGQEPQEKDSFFQQEWNTQDFAISHQAFFQAGRPSEGPAGNNAFSTKGVLAVINGDQKVRTNDRLELILKEKFEIGGKVFPKNTPVFGFITLQPNRVQIDITHIQNFPVHLKAFDVQDSNEGIYIKNSFRDEARRKVIGDVVEDINIPGLPQVRGIKNIFRKNNQNIKVTIIDQYKLLLKPEL